jgi:hypothetical protein
MNKILMFLIFSGCFIGVVYAQYVAQTLQQRIQNDKNGIASDRADEQAKWEDINSIINDNSAEAVTNSVPAIATQVQAIQAQESIVSQPVITSTPSMDTQGTINQT